jgi:hypothetical protein
MGVSRFHSIELMPPDVGVCGRITPVPAFWSVLKEHSSVVFFVSSVLFVVNSCCAAKKLQVSSRRSRAEMTKRRMQSSDSSIEKKTEIEKIMVEDGNRENSDWAHHHYNPSCLERWWNPKGKYSTRHNQSLQKRRITVQCE